jgi:dihydropteroate synthase
MGVMNVTPNSFSDGGELSLETFNQHLSSFGHIESIDIGAESTAPMNQSLSWENEWERLQPFLPLLESFQGTLSFDTYHPETIEEILRFYLDHGLQQDIIWNDVSGKFDSSVKDFLSISPKFSYVLCHNLAPKRELSGKHMEYVDPALSFEALKDFFSPWKLSQVIFDPCLGFSKTYEQNWEILENFHELQKMVGHDRWLIGFSRKSFLRKKLGCDLSQKDELDEAHSNLVKELSANWRGEVWVRTHRPELISEIK